MIKKITSIKGIGRFRHLDSKHPVSEKWNNREFKPVNIIYAENGMGKTTFTTILNSLKGDDALLTKKKTFNFSESQEIEMIIENEQKNSTQITYKDGIWSEYYENIEIFDIHFVNDNVFTGTDVLPSHRKNLFEITIGKEGKILTEKIGNIKKEIEDENSKIKKNKEQIWRLSNGLIKEYEIDNYIIIHQNKDTIQAEIELKKKEIQASQNIDIVKNKSLFKEISEFTIGINFQNLYSCLNQTLEHFSDEYLQIFNMHTEHLNDKDAKNWLEDGFNLIKEDSCPFCTQSLVKSSEIIKSYQQYFNEEYKKHQDALARFKTQLETLNETELFLIMQQILVENFELMPFWNAYVSDLQIYNPDLSNNKNELQTFLKIIKDSVNLRLSDRLSKFTLPDIESISLIEKEIQNKIELYNTNLKVHNERINQVKNGLQKKELHTLQSELNILEIQKYCLSNNVRELYEVYQKGKTRLIELDRDNKSKQKELQQYTEDTFKKYGSLINEYLKKFANYIEIKNLKSQYKGGSKEPFAEYSIFVNNHKVSFSENVKDYSMKYVLSEGDKSAIALAFFFARLAVDKSNLKHKIIVFDDPISSFDSNRKSQTLQNLTKLSNNCKQLFLLTHNINFAHEFSCKPELSIGNRCICLKIEKGQNDSSHITDFDIDQETSSGIDKNRLSLEKYLQKGGNELDKRNVVKCIRPLLEGWMRMKYTSSFSRDKWLGNFLGLISNCKEEDIIYRLKPFYEQLNDLNDYSKKYHHDSNSNADSEVINDNELRKYLEETLLILYHI